MDIRNIQKSGNMYYLYLPTAWCKNQKIGSDSKVTVEQNSAGSLTVFPQLKEHERKHLTLNISENNIDIIHKLVVACYINPASSFKILLDKEVDLASLLNQKKLISLESVEIEKNNVFCDSIVSVSDPSMLLKTMIRKIKNLIVMMLENYNPDLIQRYEDEIDKSRLLIDRAVISSLTFSHKSKHKMIDLYHLSLISKELERLTDHIIVVNKTEKQLLKSLLDSVSYLKELLEDALTENENKLKYESAIELIKKTMTIKDAEIKDRKMCSIERIEDCLKNISDVVLDWAITRELEK